MADDVQDDIVVSTQYRECAARHEGLTEWVEQALGKVRALREELKNRGL